MSECGAVCHRSGPADAQDQQLAPEPDIIELLFFSYRDFVGDADRRLAADGFGRAHHRVLHFVSRNPGMTVAGLLDLLRITKQSLNRVLKELLDKGYVIQREGAADRRQRLLHVSEAGAALAHELELLQTRRIRRALEHSSPGARAHVIEFLEAMVDWPDPRPPRAPAREKS